MHGERLDVLELLHPGLSPACPDAGVAECNNGVWACPRTGPADAASADAPADAAGYTCGTPVAGDASAGQEMNGSCPGDAQCCSGGATGTFYLATRAEGCAPRCRSLGPRPTWPARTSGSRCSRPARLSDVR